MDTKSLQIFLSNVLNKGTINSLLDSGLDYKEIAGITDMAINEGYIDIGVEQITLSPSGKEKLVELRKERKNVPQKEWILPEEKSRIRKITKDFIFLPKRNELP